MPKNKGKGGKNRRKGKGHLEEGDKRDLVFKEYMQEYAQVTHMLGGQWVMAHCFDGKDRRCRISGKMRKKVWIEPGDIILVSLRDYQDSVADVIYRYYKGEARSLVGLKEIPDSVDLSYTGVKYETVEDDVMVDFDYFGYLRDQDQYRRIRSTGVLGMDKETVEYYESLHQYGLISESKPVI